MNVYEIVTEKILEQLDKGVVPWEKPWNVAKGGMPVNAKSGRAYNGLNVLLLGMAAHAGGYPTSRWITYKQAAEIGGSVNKGEKGTAVIFWTRYAKKDATTVDGKEKATFVLRYYTVFNVAQCSGLPVDVVGKVPEAKQFDTIEIAEMLVSGYKNCPVIHHGSSGASYNPTLGTVNMPDKTAFVSPDKYYCTLFHELTHSTGHVSRIDRSLNTTFGSEPYAKEELVAELGAAFLCGMSGIDVIPHNAAYIAGWRKKLSEDSKLIVGAAARAGKAVDYITGATATEQAE